MKIFKFIISKIFLRKAILGICVMLLLCMANYITFTAARSILSTFQGYQETKYVNRRGTEAFTAEFKNTSEICRNKKNI